MLIALWLLLSGLYKPLIIGFGVVSAVLAIYVVRRTEDADGYAVPIVLRPVKFTLYIAWLFVEIAKANWAVTKIIMAPVAKTREHLFRVKHTQKTDLGKMIFATSITLTPGTITVETEDKRFLVHALNFSTDDEGALRDMDRRVSATETGGRT